MGSKNSNSDNVGLVDKYIGTAYDVVRQVFDALPWLRKIVDNLELEKGLTGDPGYTPQKGVDYFDGPEGKFIVFAFRNSLTRPPIPIGGKYNGAAVTPPTGWSNDAADVDTGEITWITRTAYSFVGNVWVNSGWSDVVRFTGADGYTPQKGVDYVDGVDGAYVSYIYQTSIARPSLPVDGEYDGEVETIPDDWSDDPVDAPAGYTIWISTTRYNWNGAFWVKDGWSEPVRFSGIDGETPQKGVDYTDGVDGTYTSFIYYNSTGKPASPVGGTYDGENETFPLPWQDNPTSPSAGVYVWVSRRKYKKVGDEYVGSDWSDPSKFSGDDGYTPVHGVDFFDGLAGKFTSYIFRNAANLPGVPAGGSYDGITEIIPTNWYDDPTTPAEGELTWVSKGDYIFDGDTWNRTAWSVPVQFNGSDGLPGAGVFTLFAISNVYLSPNSVTSTTDVDGAAKAVSIEYFDEAWSFSCNTLRQDAIVIGARENVGAGTAFGSLAYSIHRGADNSIKIYEDDVFKGTFGSAQDSDVLGIVSLRGTVTYRKNGVSFYTSSREPTGTYAFGCMMSGVGDVCSNIVLTAALPGQDGEDGIRGSRRFYAETTRTSWSNQEADNAITDGGDTKYEWDIVTLLNPLAEYAESRYWLDNTWTLLTEVIDGNLLVDGTVLARHVKAGTLTADEMVAGIVFGDQAVFKGALEAATGTFHGKVSVGSGSEVAVMSGADQTYRIWSGAAAPEDANFSVDRFGKLRATEAILDNATVTGTMYGNVRGDVEADKIKAGTVNIIDSLMIQDGAVTAVYRAYSTSKLYLGENSQTNVISVTVPNVSEAYANIIDINVELGLGSDQLKYWWGVEVRIYRNSTVVLSRHGTIGDFLDDSIVTPESEIPHFKTHIYTDDGDGGMYWAGDNYISTKDVMGGSIKFRDKYAGSGSVTYKAWVHIKTQSGTPYTWIKTRDIIAEYTKV